MEKGSMFRKLTVLAVVAVMAMMMGSLSLVFADDAAAPTLPDSVKMTGRPNAATKQADVSLALTGATDEWMNKVTAVTVDGKDVEKREAQKQVDVDDSDLKADINEFGIVKTGEGKTASYSLAIATVAFDKTPRRSNTYKIVIKADGFADVEKDLTVTSYGASKLFVRELDKSGKVLKTKEYSMEDIEKLAAFKDGVLYQGICSHHGIRGFRARGVEITDLLKDAGITFKSGDELRLRTNDADAEETVNDNPAKDNWYCEGGFSYDYLYKPRYIFTDIYQNENKALYDKLVALQGTTTEVVTGKDDQGQDVVTTFHNYLNKDLRELLATGKKKEVAPFISTEMCENDLDDPEAPGAEYGTTKENYGFRFFYGMALEEDGKAVEKDETNMRVSYYVYGIDIQHDTIEHAIDRSELDAEVQKAWELKEEDYTAESWAAFLPAFQNASKLVYIEGLNQNIKEHAKTTQAYIVQRLNELKAAEEGLVMIQKETKIKKVAPLSKKFKAKALKKAKKTFKLKATTESDGKVTFKKTKGSKKVTVSKTGKVTVKKGLKKGTYKIKITVKSAETKAFKAATKKVTLKIKVK